MVSKVVVNGNPAEESKDIENDNVEAAIKTKRIPVILEIFADPEIRKQYRRFCLEDTNIPLLMFNAVILMAGFGTRYCLQNFWTLNYVMIIAFVCGLVSIMIGAASGAVRMAVWEPIASYPLLASQVGVILVHRNFTLPSHLLYYTSHPPHYSSIHHRVGYILYCDDFVIFSNQFIHLNLNSVT